MPLAKATCTWSQFNPVMFFIIQYIYILVHEYHKINYVDFIDYVHVLVCGLKIILVRNTVQILLIL